MGEHGAAGAFDADKILGISGGGRPAGGGDCVVVAVTYNSAAHVRSCLGALTGYRVVIVDNASTDDTCSIVEREFPDVAVIRLSENLGLSRAFNIGWRRTDERHVLFINPDVVVDPSAIEELLGVARATAAAVVAPRLTYPDGTSQPTARSFPTLSTGLARRTALGRTRFGRGVVDRHLDVVDHTGGVQHVDWVLGAAMLLDRPTLELLGGFDRRYFLYCEDVDYCARVWRAGRAVVYVPGVSFTHAYQRQSKQTWNLSSRATRAHLASMARLARRYPTNFLGRPVRDARPAPARGRGPS